RCARPGSSSSWRPERLAVPGDNPDVKQIVMNLVEDTDFDAVDAGTIEESWRIRLAPRWRPNRPLNPGSPDIAPSRRTMNRQEFIVVVSRTHRLRKRLRTHR